MGHHHESGIFTPYCLALCLVRGFFAVSDCGHEIVQALGPGEAVVPFEIVGQGPVSKRRARETAVSKQLCRCPKPEALNIPLILDQFFPTCAGQACQYGQARFSDDSEVRVNGLARLKTMTRSAEDMHAHTKPVDVVLEALVGQAVYFVFCDTSCILRLLQRGVVKACGRGGRTMSTGIRRTHGQSYTVTHARTHSGILAQARLNAISVQVMEDLLIRCCRTFYR